VQGQTKCLALTVVNAFTRRDFSQNSCTTWQ